MKKQVTQIASIVMHVTQVHNAHDSWIITQVATNTLHKNIWTFENKEQTTNKLQENWDEEHKCTKKR
jgi:hypothetical protein